MPPNQRFKLNSSAAIRNAIVKMHMNRRLMLIIILMLSVYSYSFTQFLSAYVGYSFIDQNNVRLSLLYEKSDYLRFEMASSLILQDQYNQKRYHVSANTLTFLFYPLMRYTQIKEIVYLIIIPVVSNIKLYIPIESEYLWLNLGLTTDYFLFEKYSKIHFDLFSGLELRINSFRIAAGLNYSIANGYYSSDKLKIQLLMGYYYGK